MSCRVVSCSVLTTEPLTLRHRQTFSVQVPDERNQLYQQVLDFSQERSVTQKAMLLGQTLLENELILSSH